ncbi:MAG TPA: extracellular solute-binding protein [Agromyces sp.]|nr:extracellular solute-binding protein [Agromyces sp.]
MAAFAAVSAGALALAGCAPTQPASDGPTTITFWHGYTEADGDVLEQIVDDFNASQDDVVVKTEVKTWDVIDDTLLPALSADEGPEIVAMPAAVDMMTSDGTQFGVPTGFVPLAVYYNHALFDAAGIIDFPATWDEWVDVAAKLTVDENGDGTPEQYGLALPDHATVANGLWPSLFYGGGGDLVSDGEAVIDSPENVATLEYWSNAVAQNKISPTGLDGIGADELFSSGKAAMHVGGPWMASISEENDIDYGIAAIPAGPAAQAASAIGVGMGITAQADDAQVKGAEAFFSYFFSKDVATQWSLGSGWPPLRGDIPASAVASNPVVASLTEIAETGRPLLPGVTQSVDVLTAIDTATQKALAGGDPGALLSDAQAEIEAALAG